MTKFGSCLHVALFIVMCLIAVAIVIEIPWMVGSPRGSFDPASLDTPDSLSELGDSYGMANAIVSALAFVAIVYTLWLQRVDLLTNQEMLEASLKEAAATNRHTEKLGIAQENANRIAQQQNLLDTANLIAGLEESATRDHLEHPRAHAEILSYYRDLHAIAKDLRPPFNEATLHQSPELATQEHDYDRTRSKIHDMAEYLARQWLAKTEDVNIREKKLLDGLNETIGVIADGFSQLGRMETSRDLGQFMRNTESEGARIRTVVLGRIFVFHIYPLLRERRGF